MIFRNHTAPTNRSLSCTFAWIGAQLKLSDISASTNAPMEAAENTKSARERVFMIIFLSGSKVLSFFVVL